MCPSVLIVDDAVEFRHVARALLEYEGFEVVGEAEDGESAVAAVARLRPEVVLLDVQLPGPDGFAIAEQLAQTRDPPVVVLVSSHAVGSYRRRLATSRARGFIPKAELTGARLSLLLA